MRTPCGGGPGLLGLATRFAFPLHPSGRRELKALKGIWVEERSLFYRGLATIAASEARQGNMLLLDGRRVEVTDMRTVKTGRAAASINLSFVDLESFKCGEQTFSIQKKLEKIESEKQTLQLMYVDTERGVVVMADEKFDEVELPLRLFGGPSVADQLKPEMKLVVHMHEGEAIKVNLPASIVTFLRGKK